MAYKSPGVYFEEQRAIHAKRPRNAIRAAFAGNFEKGPVGEAIAITSIEEFIQHFGLPNDATYNDWFQVQRFLRYYPGIYVTRAANLEHTFDACSTIGENITVTVDNAIQSFEVNAANPYNLKAAELKAKFKKYDRFTIEGDNADNGAIYTVLDVERFSFTPKLKFDVFQGNQIMRLSGVTNASIEMPAKAQSSKIPTTDAFGNPANEPFIESVDAFNLYKDSYAVNNPQTPLSFWARSPGFWGNGLQIAVVKPEDFKVNYSASDARSAKLAFDGHIVDHSFNRAPLQGQIGILVALDGRVVESFVVPETRAMEDEINRKSAYIFVKRGIGEIYSTAFSQTDLKRPLQLVGGSDAEIGKVDIDNAYKIFEDKETYRVDVIISNEADRGMSGTNLAMNRMDATAINGAPIDLFVPRNPAKTVDNLVDFRENIFVVDGCACPSDSELVGAKVLNSSSAVFVGNYLVVHDPYSNKQRMINIAGDIAGLRCETNSKHGEWKASAGTNRGVLRDGARLVFNPTLPHRDILYSHSINPVVAMNGVGNVLWGNRTMTSLDDDFSSWHVRSLVNMLIRGSNDVIRSYVMENINPYTMHAVQSSLSPMLSTAKAGGGLTDYYIKCDTQNNTDETIADNEFHVDLYIKPTGVAEFIRVRLVNTGSETIATIIQREQLKRV